MDPDGIGWQCGRVTDVNQTASIRLRSRADRPLGNAVAMTTAVKYFPSQWLHGAVLFIEAVLKHIGT